MRWGAGVLACWLGAVSFGPVSIYFYRPLVRARILSVLVNDKLLSVECSSYPFGQTTPVASPGTPPLLP